MVEALDRLAGSEPGWGRLDCIVLAREHVCAVTGADPGLWPSGWDSERSAARLLRRLGHRDVGDLLAAILTEIPPVMAHVGDLGVIDGGRRGPSAVVVLGDRLAAVTDTGLARDLPREALIRAFRV
jgi:hypothetical protein